MKKNLRITFLQRVNAKPLYLMAIALVAVTALGLFLLSNNSITVSAQGEKKLGTDRSAKEKPRGSRVATPGMLTLALDFGAAAEYSVFANKGIEEGNSVRVWKTDAPPKYAAAAKARINEESAYTVTDDVGARAHNDLSNAFKVLQNLPCAETDSEMRDGNFKAGVYCASVGDLKGEFVLDGNGDPNSIFIFRASRSITAENTFKVTLVNGAEARNVFFVAGDTAAIGEGVNFNANIVAKNTITVDKGSTVNGRALSVEGDVALQAAAVTAATGVLQICKTAFGSGLDDKIFRFQIGASIYLVPTGSCSGPITLPAGPVVIDELVDGPTIPSGTFSGRFRLLAVGTDPANALVAENLPMRQITVNVRPGNIQNQTVAEFINTFAVNAMVEICKFPGADVDATGATVVPTLDLGDSAIRDRDVVAGTPFEFTIDVVLDTVFTVPVGSCSPLIQVNAPTSSGAPPRPADINITEISKTDSFGDPVYRLDGNPPTLAASTSPAARLNGIAFNIGLDNTNIFGFPPFFNPGGGVVGTEVLEGGAPDKTTVNFFNRSEPGYVKVCKVAGNGIPIGTKFTFTVNGREPSDTPRTTYVAPSQSYTTPSFPFPGAILPGVDTTRTLIVPAGPAPFGFCEFVRFGSPDPAGGRVKYIAGSQVLVTESATPVDPVPGVPPGEVRVSKIRLDGGANTFASPSTIQHSAVNGGALTTLNPNPNNTTRQAMFRARRGTTEVEFTDFVFGPGLGEGPGVYFNDSTFFLKNDPSPGAAEFTFTFGAPGAYQPISGDWNADGIDTVGLYDPASGNFFLTDTNGPGAANNTFQFGAGGQGYQAIVGDWNNDGIDTVGLYHPATGVFFLTDTNGPGLANKTFQYGATGQTYQALAGDWNNDGTDTVALYHPASGTFFLTDTNAAGPGNNTFIFGAGGQGYIAVAGDWNGDVIDTIGLVAPSTGTWFLRNTNAAGGADIPPFNFGPGGGTPIAGDWNGL